MGRKVSGFMIKGELPESACEILQLCGVPRSFIYEGIEPTEFEPEVEYDRIKGRATRYEVSELGDFDGRAVNDSRKIIAVKCGDWTLVLAKYAFIGFPSDYIDSYISNLQKCYEIFQRHEFESYFSDHGLIPAVLPGKNSEIYARQTFEPNQIWKARMRRIIETQLSNWQSSLALGVLSQGGKDDPFYFDIDGRSYEELLEEDEEWKTRLRDRLWIGKLNPRNYDALKTLSIGGEAIHFYTESVTEISGFARFVDGKQTEPIWRCGDYGISVFDYETGQWTFGVDGDSIDIFYGDNMEYDLLTKYAPNFNQNDEQETTVQYCYII